MAAHSIFHSSIYLFPSFMLSEDPRAPPGGVFSLCLAPKLRIRQDLRVHLSPHGGWSFVYLMSSLTAMSEVLAGLELLRSKAIKMLGLLPLNIKSSVFKALSQLCVESNYLKNAEEQRDFFPLLILLHLSFASVRREQYTAAHKSEAACCAPHESCKCRVMPHILVKPTRKQTMLLSEHSHNQGRREKAGRFFQVRKCK